MTGEECTERCVKESDTGTISTSEGDTTYNEFKKKRIRERREIFSTNGT